MVAVTRRRLLGAAGSLVLLAACGRDEAARRLPSDADVLARLLRAERRAAAAGGLLAEQDRLHAAALADALRRRGGRPEPPSPPAAGDVLARKQAAVFAYFDALPQLTSPALRVLVMRLAASEAEHLAVLRLRRGAVPVPDAFGGEGAP